MGQLQYERKKTLCGGRSSPLRETTGRAQHDLIISRLIPRREFALGKGSSIPDLVISGPTLDSLHKQLRYVGKTGGRIKRDPRHLVLETSGITTRDCGGDQSIGAEDRFENNDTRSNCLSLWDDRGGGGMPKGIRSIWATRYSVCYAGTMQREEGAGSVRAVSSELEKYPIIGSPRRNARLLSNDKDFDGALAKEIAHSDCGRIDNKPRRRM